MNQKKTRKESEKKEGLVIGILDPMRWKQEIGCGFHGGIRKKENWE